MCHCANFIKIGQNVAEILQLIIFFQNGSRPPSWICGVHFGTTSGVVGDLYYFAKFGWNRCSTIDNTDVRIFCEFGLKKTVDKP